MPKLQVEVRLVDSKEENVATSTNKNIDINISNKKIQIMKSVLPAEWQHGLLESMQHWCVYNVQCPRVISKNMKFKFYSLKNTNDKYLCASKAQV